MRRPNDRGAATAKDEKKPDPGWNSEDSPLSAEFALPAAAPVDDGRREEQEDSDNGQADEARVHPRRGLGNRPRRQGVMEKCHFCIQRTRAGRYPACLEACPTGARKFGNILDPNSEVSYIFRTKRVFIQLKEEMGTSPRFFYYFDV